MGLLMVAQVQRIMTRVFVKFVHGRPKPIGIGGLQIALSVALQGVGGMGFDKLTKTNTVTKLLQVRSLQSSFYSCHSYVTCAFCRGPLPIAVLLVHPGRQMKHPSHMTQLHVLLCASLYMSLCNPCIYP